MSCYRNMVLVLLASITLFSSGAGAEYVLIYDVDFSTPPHIVGERPAIGGGELPRIRPTKITFGHPTVVHSFGSFVDQPCVFGQQNIMDTYDQLRFWTGAGVDTIGSPISEEYDRYHIEMDVLVEHMAEPQYTNRFTILLDRPGVQTISFVTNGQDNAIMIFPYATGAGPVIGTFEFGVPIHVEIDLDVLTDSITVYLDSEKVYKESSGGDELRSVRINLTTGINNLVAVDNIRILGSSDTPSILIESDPLTLDFGNLLPGATSGPQYIKISNTGNAVLTCTLNSSNQCFELLGSNEIELPPGDSTLIGVLCHAPFMNQGLFGVNGTMEIFHNDPYTENPKIVNLETNVLTINIPSFTFSMSGHGGIVYVDGYSWRSSWWVIDVLWQDPWAWIIKGPPEPWVPIIGFDLRFGFSPRLLEDKVNVLSANLDIRFQYYLEGTKFRPTISVGPGYYLLDERSSYGGRVGIGIEYACSPSVSFILEGNAHFINENSTNLKTATLGVLLGL